MGSVASKYTVRPEWGYFIGQVVTEWLPDGRGMRLMEDFAFVDKRGENFYIPSGTDVDGKSIPSWLWGVMFESPLTGFSRVASVPHDYECVKRRNPWEVVHRMFFEACMCAGTDEGLARKMRVAVMQFGPRWDQDGNDIEPEYEDEWATA